MTNLPFQPVDATASRTPVRRWLSIALLALVMLTTTAATANAEIIDRIVARVNGEVITMFDVREAAMPFLLQEGRDPAVLQTERRDAVLEEVLQDMVDRRLLVQEAEKLELKVSDAELEQMLSLTRQQQGLSAEQFKQVIEQYGMDYEVYREMVRENLLKLRMIKIKIGSQVSVDQSEVDRVYRERFGAGSDESRYIEVAHILVRPQEGDEATARKRAEQALQKIRKGAAFEDVAKEVSEGPAASKGGYLGWFRRGDLDEDFEKAAFALEPGQVSDVVRTKFGYHVISVQAEEERQAPDADQRKEQIRAELQQREMERLLDQYLKSLRNRAFVDVRW